MALTGVKERPTQQPFPRIRRSWIDHETIVGKIDVAGARYPEPFPVNAISRSI
jgi:hypothetical protein